MRMHRRFQPIVDSMPSRLAPSSVGALTAIVQTPAPAITMPVTIVAYDTDPPETTGATPIIIAPTPPPSGTLPC